jgi:hypothetical protein
VGDGLESGDRLLRDALGGGLWREELRVFGLKCFQFGKQLVILLVAEFRGIVDIIQHIMPPYLVSKLLDFVCDAVCHIDIYNL